MTDEKLIRLLRHGAWGGADDDTMKEAADRIEALVKERDEQRLWKVEWMYKAEAIEARLAKAMEALREIG
jgi:hypothetical protein